MKCFPTAGVVAVVCVLIFSAAAAQEDLAGTPTLFASRRAYTPVPAPQVGGELTLRKEMAEVHLELTAMDAQSRPVTDLTAAQLTILDEGKVVTTITDFRRDSDLALDLGIVIDASDSVGKQLKEEKEAAMGFIRRSIRADSDRAFVEAFGTKVLFLQGPTGDAGLIADVIRNLSPLGLTSLYDAVFLACHDGFEASKRGPVRRSVVLITDGEDSYSIHGLEDAILAAQRSAVTIYAITLHPAGEASVGDRVLGRLTEATGGRHFVISRRSQLQLAFELIESELRSDYSVSYALTDGQRDGRYHRVQVQASGNRKIRTRSGYLAPER